MESAKLKRSIIKVLKQNGTYEITDNVLIDELIFQLETIATAKEDIRTRGQDINVAKEGEHIQPNPSLSIIRNATRLVLAIYKQLGITRVKPVESDPKENALQELHDLLK